MVAGSKLQKPRSSFKKSSKTLKKKKKHRRPGQDAPAVPAVKLPDTSAVQWRSPEDQARWLTDAFSAAQGPSLSHLESSNIPQESVVSLPEERDRSVEKLAWHAKKMFGESWGQLVSKGDAEKERGCPILLILCSSAVRCVQVLKGLKTLTKECKPAKLFAKHIKIEEQIKALKEFVNIAVGTPNRVRKLIDIGAFGLDRLSVVLLDMQEDAKGFTLFTIPQVKSDFWELYKVHFHQQVLDKKVRICLY